MKVNGKTIKGKEFAYDGCHKIYVIESEQDKAKAKEIGYDIYPISELEEKYQQSCELRFIKSWDLKKSYVGQFEEAVFAESED